MRLIDADALKELYEMGDELKNYEKVLSVPLPVIQQNIKDMPTIDAEPVKHGRWENLTHNEGWAYCSECHCCWEWGIINDCNVRYCPNCGAKMEVEQ